jgi:hypothetical protein
VNAEFNWWLLIVGLVIGAGLAWLVLADSSRREVDIEEREMAAESRWIADTLGDSGHVTDEEQVLDVLRLHRTYRAAAPPYEVDEPWVEPGSEAPMNVDAGEHPPMAHPIVGGESGPADRRPV